ncbi:MAG: flotillin family protein, partial [Oscillospiraceae bacterium]|nr:flotillin family protein [Oscillospiraceae bacterium]
AIRDITFDKITVWDGGGNADGKTSTANFLSGLLKSIPPMNEMFDMAGMTLPEYLGRRQDDASENNNGDDTIHIAETTDGANMPDGEDAVPDEQQG